MAQKPSQKDKTYDGLPDIHMNTAKGLTGKWQLAGSDIHMNTAKGVPTYKDVRMDTSKPDPTKKMGGLKARDKLRMDDPEVRRKATVAQLCEHPELASIRLHLITSCRFPGLLLPDARIPGRS